MPSVPRWKCLDRARPGTAAGEILEQSFADLRIPGDIDGNDHVDTVDLLYFVEACGSVPGDANHDTCCDFNQDASLDVVDLSMMVESWGL